MVTGWRRVRRWALAFGAVLLALGAAVTWGPGLLDLERYRGQIARQVGRAIGREVSVGAITASFWRLGAEARGIRVADRAGYGEAPFVEADALRLRVELLPLLRGQVRVATAALERPRIHLVRDRHGHWNAEDLWSGLGPGAAATSTGRPAPEIPRAPRPAAAGAFLVRDLRARQGDLQIDDLRAAPESGASFALHNVRLDVRQGDPPDGMAIRFAGEVSGGALEGAATLMPRGNSLTVDGRGTLKDFELSALDAYVGQGRASGRANLAFTAKGQLPALDVTGELDLAAARLDVGLLARKAPGEEAHLTFAGRFLGQGMDLPDVRLRWRGATLEGRVTAARLQPLEVTFAAKAPQLDLDKLLAPPGAPQGAAGKAAEGSGFFGRAAAWASPPPGSAADAGARDGPASGGLRIRVDGAVRAATMRWHGLEARDVQAKLAYHDTVLTVRDVTAKVFGGSLVASGTVDLRGRYPTLAATGRLAEAQLQPLVAAIAPGKKLEAHGVLSGDGKITSPGLAAGNVLGSLEGSGGFVVRDGRVAGYKPLERLGEMLTSATGGVSPLKARLDEFQRLSGTFTLDKGSLRTQDLTLIRPDGQAKAAGSMNLLDTSLDFTVTVQLGKVSLEAKVLGPAADPQVVPTVARLDKRFEQEFDRALKGDRGKKLRDLLRNLLQ